MKKIAMIMAVLALAAGAQADIITNVSVYDVSGQLGGTWSAERTLDGDPGTFWYSAVGAPAYITYAFDQAYDLDEATLTMSSGNYRKLAQAAVSVSTNGVDFNSVGTFAIDVANGAVSTMDLSGYTAQYVKIDAAEGFYANWDPDYQTSASVGDFAVSFAEISFTNIVPEPVTMMLMAAGIPVLLKHRRRRG